jgi:hypothetical protein
VVVVVGATVEVAAIDVVGDNVVGDGVVVVLVEAGVDGVASGMWSTQPTRG